MADESQFCSHCGSRNEADAGYCESCGQRLDGAAPTAPAAASAAAPAVAAPAATTKRRMSPGVVALIAVVLLGGAGVVIFAGPLKSLLGSSGDSPGAGDSLELSGATTGAGEDSTVIEIHPRQGSGSAVSRPGTIATGSVLTLRSSERICSSTNSTGDPFSALVQRAVKGSNGATIPKGAEVTFLVDRASNAELSVSVQSIDIGDTTYPLTATVDTVDVKTSAEGGLPPMPPLPSGIPPGAVVTRPIGGGSADRCIEPNAMIRITLREDLLLSPP